MPAPSPYRLTPLRRPLAALAALLLGFALIVSSSAASPPMTAKQRSSAGEKRSTQGGKRAHSQRARTHRQAKRRAQRQRRRKAAWRRAGRRVGLGANAAVGQPTTGPAESKDVLDAGFEQGLANWNTAGVGEVVPSVVGDIVRSGARASVVSLHGAEGRSELILGGDGGGSTDGMVEFREGDEYWYGFSFYIDSMVYGGPGAHNLIMQFKSDGEGSPNFGLQLWDYEGDDGESGGRGLWSTGEAMGGDRFLAPLSERAWHDVAIHFKASSAGAGFYEVFLDGRQIDSRSGVSMIVPGHEYAYLKNGLYRNGDEIPGTSELRLDAARLGRSPNALAVG